MSDHITPEQFERLLAEQLAGKEQDAIVAHVEICQECEDKLTRLADEVEHNVSGAGEPRQSSPVLPGPEPPAQEFLRRLKEKPPVLPATVPGAQDGADEPAIEFPGPPTARGRLGQLESYHIDEKLGRGGFGVVFKAYDAQLDRFVAIKVLNPELAASAKDRARFEEEARRAAAVGHDHIVTIHRVGNTPEFACPYFVMEYLDESLADRLEREGPLAAKEAAGLIHQISLGLAAAHEKNLIHRDMKPANVMLDRRTGRAKVTDFGLAKRLGAENTQSESMAIKGTPSYMAPEQTTGDNTTVGPLADVYGLGAILYALLTGRPPFLGANLLDTLQQVQSLEPVTPCRLQPKLPRDLETICLKALAKAPKERYASAKDLADDVRRFLDGQPIRAQPAGTVTRSWRWCRRNRSLAGLMAAVALLVVAVIGTSITMAILAQRDARNQKVASLLHELQLLRSNPHQKDWSQKAFKLGVDAARIRADSVVKSQLATTLVGLDVTQPTQARHFDFGASSVLFAPEGRQIVVGGVDPSPGRTAQPARLANLDTGDIEVESFHKQAGPVGFRDGRFPIQLVVKMLLIDRAEVQFGALFASPIAGPLHFLLTYWFRDAPWPRSLQVWSMAQREVLSECKLVVNPAEDIAVTAMTPDGSRIAAVTWPEKTGSVTVWDGVSGRELATFRKPARALAFAPSKVHLATGDSDGQVTVWPVDGRDKPTTFRGTRLLVNCLAFSPDNRVLAVGDSGGMVTLWEWQTRGPLLSFRGSDYQAFALAFSPDGSLLASGGRHEIRFWDLATGAQLLEMDSGDNIMGLAFSKDGRQLAVGTLGLLDRPPPEVHIWNVENGRGLQTLRGLSSRVERIRLSLDGRFLAALAHNWQIGIWDLTTGQRRWLLDAPPGLFVDNADLAFSPDGSLLAFSGGTYAALWDLHTGERKKIWTLPPGLQDALAFDSSGRLLSLRNETKDGKQPPYTQVDWRQFPRVCRLRNLFASDDAIKKPIKVIDEFNVGAVNIIASLDGNYFVAEGIHVSFDDKGRPVSARRTVRAIEGPTGKKLWNKEPTKGAWDPGAWVGFLDYSTRCLRLISDTSGQTKHSWVDLATGNEIEILNEGVHSIAPQGSYRLVSVFPDGKDGPAAWGLMRPGSGEPLIILGTEGVARASTRPPLFNHDGSRLIWGNADGTIIVCDLSEVQRRLSDVGLGW